MLPDSPCQMRVLLEILLIVSFTLMWNHQIVIGGSSVASRINSWSCTCYAADQGNLSFIVPAKCYSSCNCNLEAGRSTAGEWLCNCVNDSLPKVISETGGTSCFTRCNCSSGTQMELRSAKKRSSPNVVIIVLLLCIALTTLALLASVSCHFYHKERWNIRPLSSPEIESSVNSATSLISQRASSVAKFKDSFSFSFKPMPGCLRKASLLLTREANAIHGMIIEFSYSELESATNKFSDSNLIGIGGSSHVYRGCLKDGKIVAVKRMKTKGGPDAESSFLTEIEVIARLHHCHVVPLLGYCSERHGKSVERLLIFEYMSNGNVRDCLDAASEKALDWSTRVTIAIGAARGLEYLHEAAAPRILHRDVKSTNVLLDENWRAKITDLGMAKHIHPDGISSCSSSPARMQGTFGYFAPEYAIVGRASLKSDVFSFGVVLLELITGRQAIQSSISASKVEESLVIWASSRLQDSKRVISELPDPNLDGIFDKEEMHVMAYLAKECLLLDPDSRPTMREVVQILSTIAPDKSKRSNMSFQIFQSSSKGTVKRGDINPSDNHDMEEIKYVMHDKEVAVSSLPSDVTVSSGLKKSRKEKENGGVEKVGLPKPSSNRSWFAQDEDVVDLTEPRFESFLHVQC